jgi:EF hand
MKADRNLRRNTVLALSGVAIVGLAAHAALAQTRPIGITQHDEVYNQMIAKLDLRFEDIDINGDGYINKSEAASVPGLMAVFDRADKNGDNKLDRVEFSAALALMQARP